MAKPIAKQLPLKLRKTRKTDVRAQFAALCWRMKGDQIEVCLVTSRARRRWIIPKGWPMHKQTPAEAAATEAYEEAGVSGDALNICLGVYTYARRGKLGGAPIVTMVYPVQVTKVHNKWPEKHQRKRKWVSLAKAARKLQEPELQRIVATFKPHRLRK